MDEYSFPEEGAVAKKRFFIEISLVFAIVIIFGFIAYCVVTNFKPFDTVISNQTTSKTPSFTKSRAQLQNESLEILSKSSPVSDATRQKLFQILKKSGGGRVALTSAQKEQLLSRIKY